MVRVGLIGCGYWGPQLARNFHELCGSELKWICDFRADRLDSLGRLYPEARLTSSFAEVLASDVDAVSLATPASTHCELALRALQAGKHVLIEKPLATTAADAERLVREGRRRNRIVMAGHTFVYNPAVQLVREIIASGELGDVYHISGSRLSLGLFQPDINVLWDLAPHDVSILLYILNAGPRAVSARGGAYVQKSRGIHDVAHVSMQFPNDVMADVHLSWLNPVKVRYYTFVGSKKMLVYDDLADDKVVLYDKHVTMPSNGAQAGFSPSYHSGESIPVPVEWTEPLRNQCAHFVSCIEHHMDPLTDAAAAADVVRVLEAADHSLHENGAWITMPPEGDRSAWDMAELCLAPAL